ncbi:hypothetical protein H8K90_14235 [Winogradskyella echinorum]|uniref:Calx-beta domain-containing protein n=1 Tax=Winogradskyella echinorum TaxID=538189 RepID=A0ABR6Y499_9FLAO|nr:hypothetical protein [Winogradskyella echinorum]MBC3847552.1 hypothetical protein [Winogradskyella echinorum]MBC5751900.1 hypothetical protein [Winogradskyella echinorum]
MKKILNYIFVGVLVTFAYNCEEDLPSGSTNYVTLEADRSIRIENNATVNEEIVVYTGNRTGSARTFTVMVDPSSTLSADNYVLGATTVTIPANSNVGTIPLTLTDNDDLSFSAKTLVLDLQNESGINFGDNLVLDIAELCTETVARLTVNTDNWPDETTWELYSLTGGSTLIASGGPYINPDDDFSSIINEFCLSAGDYGVVMYDSYGDGVINEAETAYIGFSVTINGVEVAAAVVGPSASPGNESSFASDTFTVN